MDTKQTLLVSLTERTGEDQDVIGQFIESDAFAQRMNEIEGFGDREVKIAKLLIAGWAASRIARHLVVIPRHILSVRARTITIVEARNVVHSGNV